MTMSSLTSENEGNNEAELPLVEERETTFDAIEQEGVGAFASTRNLTSTILGAGILTVPYAISKAGIFVGIGILVMAATASVFSCDLLIASYLCTGKGSYGDLAAHLAGKRTSIFVRWIIVLMSLGAITSHVIIARNLVPPSLCQVMGKELSKCETSSFEAIVTAVLMFGLVWPLCSMESMASLKNTSMFAFMFAIFLTVAIIFRSLENDKSCDVRFVANYFGDVFRSLSVFCFSFVCHLNVVPVYEQLRDQSKPAMKMISRQAIAFATGLYALIGVFGYLNFSCSSLGVPGNILQFDTGSGGFSDQDGIITAARFAEALICILAIPLINFPIRIALMGLLFGNKEMQRPIFARTVLAFVVVFVAFWIGIAIPSVVIVFEVMGSTGCALIVFILPGLFYFGAMRGEEHGGGRESKRMMACTVVGFGTIGAICGSASTFSHLHP